MSKIYYVYRHVRSDTDEVFYVGLGTFNPKGKSEKVCYPRAFQKTKNGRSEWWHRITKRTCYSVEIIFQSPNKKLIKQKETEFIKLYGRKDLDRGTLINFTDGGEAPLNQKFSTETRLKMSANSKLRTGENGARSKTLFVYNIDGTFYKSFPSFLLAAEGLGIYKSTISKVLSGAIQRVYSWTFRREYLGDKIDINLRKRFDHREVRCFDKNKNLIHQFSSIEDAALTLKSNYGAIYAACQRMGKHRGFFLSFQEAKI